MVTIRPDLRRGFSLDSREWTSFPVPCRAEEEALVGGDPAASTGMITRGTVDWSGRCDRHRLPSGLQVLLECEPPVELSSSSGVFSPDDRTSIGPAGVGEAFWKDPDRPIQANSRGLFRSFSMRVAGTNNKSSPRVLHSGRFASHGFLLSLKGKPWQWPVAASPAQIPPIPSSSGGEDASRSSAVTRLHQNGSEDMVENVQAIDFRPECESSLGISIAEADPPSTVAAATASAAPDPLVERNEEEDPSDQVAGVGLEEISHSSSFSSDAGDKEEVREPHADGGEDPVPQAAVVIQTAARAFLARRQRRRKQQERDAATTWLSSTQLADTVVAETDESFITEAAEKFTYGILAADCQGTERTISSRELVDRGEEEEEAQEDESGSRRSAMPDSMNDEAPETLAKEEGKKNTVGVRENTSERVGGARALWLQLEKKALQEKQAGARGGSWRAAMDDPEEGPYDRTRLLGRAGGGVQLTWQVIQDREQERETERKRAWEQQKKKVEEACRVRESIVH